MSYMTRLPGVFDKNNALPGMAYFSGSGPQGKTCGGCAFRGYQRDGKYHGGCRRYRQLAGHDGPAVKKTYPACREFQQIEKAAIKPVTPDESQL
jgi:hypothetical protein